LRASAQGNWLSLTVTVRLESRAQLEGLYRALGVHPLVRMVI
jgi:putative lipoic acid-binding regulatory protein